MSSEMEDPIKELKAADLRLSNKMEFIVEQQAKLETSLGELTINLNKLTGIVTDQALRFDALQGEVQTIKNVVRDSIAQAEADRAEIRGIVAAVKSFASEIRESNAEMRAAVTGLAEHMRQLADGQSRTNERVTKLEQPPEK